MSEVLLEVNNLKKYFPITRGFIKSKVGDVKAVDDVSLFIKEGETLGIVGESGCGKSTLGRTLLRLYDATAGEVRFRGKDVLNAPKDQIKELRKEMQIVFQDPYSSLNPRMTVSQIVGEALVEHGLYRKGKELDDYVVEIMNKCGLARYHMNRYPHEFSGGQRQRIGVARALALSPSFIVADEPVSALDVSIQSQVINLFTDLQRELNISYMFISHDLGVVRYISHRVGVMYLGSMVELADKNALFDNSKHPYTQALLSAIPHPDPTMKRDRIILEGDIPSPANPPSGCKFHTRCMYVEDICREEVPEFRDLGGEHFVACHLAK
ncbi:oligopeptide ABC transporter (ATP-binding protein) [[Clostridium] ultunense Esp]|uniref:Oligopeptide ABC transporter (ATP-binding protein) n=1 Tax=[Clostridium] ultunense Esp TaxID=1288971 RepID=M1Z7R1_9FIRM|nr:dipeptide ABC transporter ATP-binding protein [Schnuerera ultunensis]CCQ94071.1 oligopeptide ABC transporter (ATP-binding protein) [[Clostridium] ultunense Esp]SHD75523.1 oligopeptide ABC transporter (ATP-binding protein) [[Clostridium] ultunense Esp]